MFKKTLTNFIEPLINNRFNQLNQSIEEMKGLQIKSIQNLQNQITNLNLDELDIPSAYDIACEISIDADDIAQNISARDIGRNIDASEISIDWSVFTNAVAELSAKLTTIETQLATLSKPKATKKPTVKKPVAKK